MPDHHLQRRRAAILKLIDGGSVSQQAELASLLRKQGFEVTQSSVSRDLRELGVLKGNGRYLPPATDAAHARVKFGPLAQFVRSVRPAGPSLTVIRTTTGAAQSVTVAIDRADWPEVVGTVSGDDTIFVATAGGRAQRRLQDRLRELFGA